MGYKTKKTITSLILALYVSIFTTLILYGTAILVVKSFKMFIMDRNLQNYIDFLLYTIGTYKVELISIATSLIFIIAFIIINNIVDIKIYYKKKTPIIKELERKI